MQSLRLVLASASPRRAALLHTAGVAFDVMASDVDESVLAGETPDQHVRRLAASKAGVVAARVAGRPVLAADTVVVVDDQILGKPADANEARRMLGVLSGRAHTVMTGVALAHGAAHPTAPPREPDGGGPSAVLVEVAVTTVEFAPLTEAEIDWYADSGEPADKAGAYAIQGLASRFVRRIDGSYSNVVGLPVALVHNLCKRAGLLIF
jgi:nucleoside triphosphate pyrophosphatase